MNNVVGGAVASSEMATRRRPIFYEDFGEYMRKLRLGAHLESQPQAELRARQLKLSEVSQQRITLSSRVAWTFTEVR